jgi:lysyl-tRNA synthetase class 2
MAANKSGNDGLTIDWRPHASVDIARQRASMMNAARRFFADRKILEVDTPALSVRAVTEPNIESLKVSCDNSLPLYLQTSPEHFMKRLLADGYPDIYQVSKVFRDGEWGRHHRTEFTMVEWYRLNFSLQEIMKDTIEFVCHALERPDLVESANYLDYVSAFEAELNIDPLAADTSALMNIAARDLALIGSLDDDRDALLDLLLTSNVTSNFPRDRLSVLYHYPASQAALAQRCRADNRVADRFEVYYGSLELANGFVELTDADEQQKRFEDDQTRRRQLGKEIHAIDEKLIAALRHGLPACSGVAVGFDRLLMVRTGCDDIGSVNTFTIDSR